MHPTTLRQCQKSRNIIDLTATVAANRSAKKLKKIAIDCKKAADEEF